MTVNELARDVAHQQGEDWHDPDIIRLFEAWVVEGVEAIGAAHPWPFLVITLPLAVSAGVVQYDVSPVISGITSVSEPSTGRKLQYTPQDELAELRVRDLTGLPTRWSYAAIDETVGYAAVKLWPTPTEDTTLELSGVRTPSYALASSDTIPLPPEFVRVLREFVRAQYRENSDDGAGADRAWKRYGAELTRFAERYVNAPARWAKMQPVDVPRLDPFGVPRIPNTIS